MGNCLCVQEFVKVIYLKVYDNLCGISAKEYIIEDIASGVVINYLDAIAKWIVFSTFWPKLFKEDKLKVLFIAFEALRKGYDYQFYIMQTMFYFAVN